MSVACIYEVLLSQARRAGETSLSNGQQFLLCIVGWVVAFVAWVLVAILGPYVTDNKPQISLRPYGVDPQV